MFNLADYKLVYEIGVMPTIIIASMTPANQPLYYEVIEVPPHLKAIPIECRFLLFDPTGNLIEMAHEIQMASMLVTTVNMTPLKMINKFLAQLPKVKL